MVTVGSPCWVLRAIQQTVEFMSQAEDMGHHGVFRVEGRKLNNA